MAKTCCHHHCAMQVFTWLDTRKTRSAYVINSISSCTMMFMFVQCKINRYAVCVCVCVCVCVDIAIIRSEWPRADACAMQHPSLCTTHTHPTKPSSAQQRLRVVYWNRNIINNTCRYTYVRLLLHDGVGVCKSVLHTDENSYNGFKMQIHKRTLRPTHYYTRGKVDE